MTLLTTVWLLLLKNKDCWSYRGSCNFVHSIDLTFKKLKGPWLFRRPASFPSTVKGFSDVETKASFPDHSIAFTHLEFPAKIRVRLCTRPEKQEYNTKKHNDSIINPLVTFTIMSGKKAVCIVIIL